MFVYWICAECGKSGRYTVQRPEGHQLNPMSLDAELELIAQPWRLLQANHPHEIKIVPEEDPRLAHRRLN